MPTLRVKRTLFGWPGRILLVAVLAALPALGALDSVTELFQAARYGEARNALEEGNEGLRAGEATLWQARFADDPDKALVILREGLQDKRLPDEVRIRLTLESADIEYGLGRYQSCLKALSPLLAEDQAVVPGEAFLKAGLSCRALGSLQQAREMLASVKPGDPAFLAARYYLGDIALEQNDPALALRYFDAAVREAGSGSGHRVAGGKWRALMGEGRDEEALELESSLAREAPGSLAMLEIQRIRRARQEEMSALETDDSEPPEDEEIRASRGRYALQIGAFSDRRLALEFVRRYVDQLPDLRIDEIRDDRGQFLYKVRTGSFVNPALARTEAQRLARQLDIDVIVADLSGTENRTD